MINSNYRGKLGEDFVLSFLKSKGAKILEKNFKTRRGEIDIVAEEKGRLCFIEVKTRLENSAAEPMEYVDFRKQRKIILAAMEFLAENPTDLEISFDVYEVVCLRNCYFKVKQLKIHRGAFVPDENNSRDLNF